MRRARVIRVALDEPLEPVEIAAPYEEALLIAVAGEAAVGQVRIRGRGRLEPAAVRAEIEAQLAEPLARRRLSRVLRRAAREGDRPGPPPPPAPSVSVVICTRDRPEPLRACLGSLQALRTSPLETVVVDNGPDEATRRVCERFGVRHVPEPAGGLSRARNRGIVESRGEVIAFTDDDCTVEPGWLDDLGEAFADPLVGALTGFVAPLELESDSQRHFEAHGGFEMHYDRIVFEDLVSPVTTASALGDGNAFFRRSVLREIGLFDEAMGPGTPARSKQDAEIFYRLLAGGYRAVFDPRRIVWHRHRWDGGSLARVLGDYARGSGAYAARCLLWHREPGARRVLWWWLRHHLPRDLRQIVARHEDRLPLRMALAEAAGALAGPAAMLRSARARRPPALTFPVAAPPAALPEPEPAAGAAGAAVMPPEPAAGAAGITITRPEPAAVSVVVPSHNRRARLLRVMAGLLEQTHPAERMEAVVVLDGSRDGSAEALRALSTPFPVRVVEQPRRGVAASRNRGVSAARNELVVFLDDDLVPGPGLVAEHAAAHAERRDDPLVLGYHPPWVSSRDPWTLMVRRWWEDHFRRKAEPGHRWTRIDFCSGNSSLRRRRFLDAGGFDPVFVNRGEDWELGVRLLQRGVPFVYRPQARGSHLIDTGLDTALRNAREEGRNDVLMARRHPHLRDRLHFAKLLTARAGGLPLVASHAYGRPRRVDLELACGPPVARVLERARARRRWDKVVTYLRGLAYLRGVREELPTLGALTELVGEQRPGGARVGVDLAHAGGLAVPPAPGAVALDLRWDGEPLGRIPVLAPGRQWDWDSVDWLVQSALWPVLGERLAALAPEDRVLAGEED